LTLVPFTGILYNSTKK